MKRYLGHITTLLILFSLVSCVDRFRKKKKNPKPKQEQTCNTGTCNGGGDTTDPGDDVGTTDPGDGDTNPGDGSDQFIDLEVTAHSPATNVTVDRDSNIVITFNQTLSDSNAYTFANMSLDLIQVLDESGTRTAYTASASGNMLTINPTNSLLGNHVYTVRIRRDMTSIDGTTMASDFNFVFNTDNSTPSNPTYTVRLTWSIPTLREDGSALELYEINGYRLRHGTEENNQNQIVDIPGAAVVEVDVDLDSQGVHYFSIATEDSDGLLGNYSPSISLDIR